jgi:hypothetical protein
MNHTCVEVFQILSNKGQQLSPQEGNDEIDKIT